MFLLYDGKRYIGFFEEDTHGGCPRVDFKDGADFRAFMNVVKASGYHNADDLLYDLLTEKL